MADIVITRNKSLPDSSEKSDFHELVSTATIDLMSGTIVNEDISLTANISDGKLAQISSTSKVAGQALTGLTGIPSGAGAIPIANAPTSCRSNALFWFVSYPTTSTTTSVGLEFTMPTGGTITKCWLRAKSNATGTDTIVDIHINGTTIWTGGTNRAKILTSASTGNQTSFSVTAFSAGDVITAFVDQASTSGATGLTIQLDYTIG